MATLRERLDEFYRRLLAAPKTSTADEALSLLGRTLNEVEDELSGVAKADPPPPPPGEADGRMYPPQEDFIRRYPDGSLTAETRRHTIDITADGQITIRHRRTGDVEFER